MTPTNRLQRISFSRWSTGTLGMLAMIAMASTSVLAQEKPSVESEVEFKRRQEIIEINAKAELEINKLKRDMQKGNVEIPSLMSEVEMDKKINDKLDDIEHLARFAYQSTEAKRYDQQKFEEVVALINKVRQERDRCKKLSGACSGDAMPYNQLREYFTGASWLEVAGVPSKGIRDLAHDFKRELDSQFFQNGGRHFITDTNPEFFEKQMSLLNALTKVADGTTSARTLCRENQSTGSEHILDVINQEVLTENGQLPRAKKAWYDLAVKNMRDARTAIQKCDNARVTGELALLNLPDAARTDIKTSEAKLTEILATLRSGSDQVTHHLAPALRKLEVLGTPAK